jgi:hypothetical protein
LSFRATHYKLIAVKQIVQQMLIASCTVDELPELLLPGEITLIKMKLPPVGNNLPFNYHFWLPDCAPWCASIQAHMQASVPGLSVKRAPPGEFARGLQTVGDGDDINNVRRRRRSSIMLEEEWEASVKSAQALLMPLNKNTLLSKAVQDDLSAALKANIQLVLLHIQDEEFGAAPFGAFFEQCPAHLQNAGLFDGESEEKWEGAQS